MFPEIIGRVMKSDSAIVFTGTEKNNKAQNSKKHYSVSRVISAWKEDFSLFFDMADSEMDFI